MEALVAKLKEAQRTGRECGRVRAMGVLGLVWIGLMLDFPIHFSNICHLWFGLFVDTETDRNRFCKGQQVDVFHEGIQPHVGPGNLAR